MVVALAHAHVSLQSVVDQLDSDQWESWMVNLSEVDVIVEMPKFTIEYEISLKDVLTSLGMEIAFHIRFRRFHQDQSVGRSLHQQREAQDVRPGGRGRHRGRGLHVCSHKR